MLDLLEPSDVLRQGLGQQGLGLAEVELAEGLARDLRDVPAVTHTRPQRE